MDGQTNERYGEIRSETVGGPSRLASIHSPPNSLDLLISFSSRTLSLFLFLSLSIKSSFLPSSSCLFDSPSPRFPSTSRFQHPFRLPVTPLSHFLSCISLRRSYAFIPFPLVIPLVVFFSPRLRRILFSSSFSPRDPLRHLPAILTSRSTALRTRPGTRNSFVAANTRFDYSRLHQQPILRVSVPPPRLISVYILGSSCRCRSNLTSYEMKPAARHARAPVESRAKIFPLLLSLCLTLFDRRARFFGDFFLLRTNDASSRSSDARFDPTGRYLSTDQPGGLLTRRDRP